MYVLLKLDWAPATAAINMGDRADMKSRRPFVAGERSSKFGRGVPRGQRGELLIESMISVALMAILLVTLMAALVLAARTAITTNNVARGGNEATKAAEAIDRLQYVPCASATSYALALPASASIGGFTATVESVKALQSQTARPAAFVASCPVILGVPTDQGAQQLVVKVTSKDVRAAVKVTIVKRDDRCPSSVVTVPGQRC